MEMVKQGWVHLEEGPCKKLKGWRGQCDSSPLVVWSLRPQCGGWIGDMETRGSYYHIQQTGDGVWTRVVTLVTKGQGKTHMIGRKRKLQYLG